MITIKPQHFYLFLRNVDKGLIENKEIKQYVSNAVIKVKGIHMINGCDKLLQLYNNNHFSMKEFCLHILYKLLMEGGGREFLYNPSKWDIESISKVSNLFSEERNRKDQDFIIQVSKKTGFDSIQNYFNINSNGESLVYDFMKNQYISPLFILRYKSAFNVSTFPESAEHENARRIIDVIEQVINLKIIN
jgi:hypothetical protein